jgi:hypothetical protein
MLDCWEAARRPIAILTGENKVQLLQLKRLVASHAPRHGAVFGDLELARSWILVQRGKM